MLTVLHDGSLLLKDDYTAEWVFYSPTSKATTRFPSGGIRFVQEYKSGGKWYMNMAFSSRYNYQENREERDEEDMDGNSSKWDLYSATYQITTDQMYELAGFEP
ncbi:MAG: hypothetical protein D6B26_01700 [Spirochaetaceae bacterium]|nr:MAG: hypothetical protein D6B26_01700 [Spirochaetaceae bacterium]